MTKHLKTKDYKYSFKETIWKYKGPAGWYFISIPIDLSIKIRKKHVQSEEGWGRLKAEATIGKSKWKTSIWYDTKRKTYLLPVKAKIRKDEDLSTGKLLSVNLSINELKICTTQT